MQHEILILVNISLSIVYKEFTPAVLGLNRVHGCKSCIHFTVDDFTDSCALWLVCFNSIGDYSFISYSIGDSKPQMVKIFRDILGLCIQHGTFRTQFIAVNKPLKFMNFMNVKQISDKVFLLFHATKSIMLLEHSNVTHLKGWLGLKILV